MSAKRKAIGLFHFNIHYLAGDIDFYARYIREVVAPFLSVMEAKPEFRTTVHVCGADIEYLAERAPDVLDRLRILVDANRVELLSALYSNSIWVAFPQRDLIRSIEINRRVLDRYSLRASDAFFAQEAFFGAGLRSIAPYFSRAVCKDDYLKPAIGSSKVNRAYHLGKLTVIVGSDHLLNRISTLATNESNRSTLLLHKKKLDAVRLSNLPASYSVEEGVCWYHFGSAHHLVTAGFPHRRETFSADGDWIALVGQELNSIGQECEFSFIREQKYDHTSLSNLPQIPEGSWNYQGSSGVRRWMGWHTSDWERDSTVLGTAWQTRSSLRQYESSLSESGDLNAGQAATLDQLWKKQLLVEGSDALGWQPRKIEVESSLREAERLQDEISRLSGQSSWQKPFLQTVSELATKFGTLGTIPKPMLTLPVSIGQASLAGWNEIVSGVWLLQVDLKLIGQRTGVQFFRASDSMTYSPSGDEGNPVTLDSAARIGPLFLPLSNGLISLSDSTYLIRINRYGMVAAELSQGFKTVEFTVEGPGARRISTLLFLMYHGSLHASVMFANQINEV